MIQSMTGYFSGEFSWNLSSQKQVKLFVEIKTLNSRFFEVSSKLPSALSVVEQEITNIFRRKLVRGKVFFHVKVLSSDDSLEQPCLNEQLLENYAKMAKIVKKHVDNSANASITDWLLLPKLIYFESEILKQEDLESLLKNIETWVDGLIKEREKEGQGTLTDLQKAKTKIISELDKLILVNTNALAKIKEDLEIFRKKLINLREQMTPENEHLLQLEQKKYADLEFSLDKSNINEEIVRAKMHLTKIEHFFQKDNLEIGKKLEFTLQELVREVNTISSKSNNFEINSACVEIKFELEKMREQSQNIV